MAYDVTTTPAVGDATKQTDYTRLRDAIKAASQQHHFLGGHLDSFVTDASFVDAPNGAILEIDGTNLSGMSVFLAATFLSTSSVTFSVRLFNITTGSAVSSSTIALAVTANVKAYSKSSALTLATGVNQYKLQIQSNGTAEAAALGFVNVRG